jgi:hypothetical protein
MFESRCDISMIMSRLLLLYPTTNMFMFSINLYGAIYIYSYALDYTHIVKTSRPQLRHIGVYVVNSKVDSIVCNFTSVDFDII